MNKIKTGLLLSLLVPVMSYGADESNIDFPVGLWHTTHYRIAENQDRVLRSPVELDICVQPDGTWQTLNSPDGMNGRWTRENNDVHLTGNGWKFAGTGDISLVTPYKKMSGNWLSWPLTKKDSGHLSYVSEWRLTKPNSCLL